MQLPSGPTPTRRNILRTAALAPVARPRDWWPFDDDPESAMVAVGDKADREHYDPEEFDVYLAREGTWSYAVDGEWQRIASSGSEPEYDDSRVDAHGRWRGPVVHPGYDHPDLPITGINGRELWDDSRDVPVYDRGDGWESPAFTSDAITSKQQVANTITETSVFSVDLEADTLETGQVYVFPLSGSYTTNDSSDTFTLRWKVGGTTVSSTTSVAAQVTDAPVDVTLRITVRSTGANGSFGTFTSAIFDDSHNDDASNPDVAVDTTAVNSVEATVEWGVAESGNSVEIEQGWKEQKI